METCLTRGLRTLYCCSRASEILRGGNVGDLRAHVLPQRFSFASSREGKAQRSEISSIGSWLLLLGMMLMQLVKPMMRGIQEESDGKRELTTVGTTVGIYAVPPSLNCLTVAVGAGGGGGLIGEGSSDPRGDLGCRHTLGQRNITSPKLDLRTYSHMTLHPTR